MPPRITTADILAAFKSWWDASALAAVYAGPFRGLAPEGTEQPLVIVDVPSSVLDGRTNRSEFWLTDLTLKVYDETTELAEQHIGTIKAELEAAELVVSGGYVVRLDCNRELVIEEDKRTHAGVIMVEVLWRKPKVGGV